MELFFHIKIFSFYLITAEAFLLCKSAYKTLGFYLKIELLGIRFLVCIHMLQSQLVFPILASRHTASVGHVELLV